MRLYLSIISLLFFAVAKASSILIPMDESQKNHLKAYGIAFWLLENEQEVDWLLNYRGGSFMFAQTLEAETECKLRGVGYEVITAAKANSIQAQIASPEENMNVVSLLTVPKIAVYSPKTKQPWDDAVTLVLSYAEIPYTVIFDDEVLGDTLIEFDWLHLHHEDFSGQYGKFYAGYRSQPWYQDQVAEAEAMALKHGFKKVSELKLAIAQKIRDFTLGGGFLFAMCSATDSYDIALASDETDICHSVFDGDPIDQNCQQKLNYKNTFAFKDFTLSQNIYEYEFSDIDVNPDPRFRGVTEETDIFTLFDYSAKADVVPTILCQNHTRTIKGFMGQTTAFKKPLVKSNVLIMGENVLLNEAKYIHSEMGKGTFTFYGGHDPEDYQHMVGEPPTDLALNPNSPGYRLILNNILFPSAKKNKLKT